MLNIYIPTFNRVDRQVTYDRLPEAFKKKVQLVVSKDEAKAHKALGRNVLVCPVQGKGGVAPVRQWILEYAHKQGQKKIVMVDDDVVLQKRQPNGRIINATTLEDYTGAFKWVEDALSDVAHCGWGVRFLNWASKEDESSPSRMVHCLAYNVPKVMKTGARFDNVPIWYCQEDFHMTLQLLEAGETNRVSLIWRSSPAPSNTPGGWSGFRSLERQNEIAELTAKMHPEVVKVRVKKNKWKGMEAETKDVTVQWRKALQLGLARKGK